MLRSNFKIAEGILAGKTILDENNLSLKYLLGPDRGDGAGILIARANELPNPDYYRSIIGAEKSPTPVRIFPEFLNQSGKIEPQYVEFYNLAKDLCRFEGDAWQAEATAAAIAGLGIFNRGTVNRCRDRRDRWRAGLSALKNMDKSWGYIIGSYRYETRMGTRQVYDPYKCSGGPVLPELYPYSAKAEDIALRIAPLPDDPDCDPWVWETYTYTVRIPLKNDGVFSPHYGVWEKGSSPYDKSAHNYYYDDSGDGGYNDLELLRYRRNYTQGANKKGELAKPMRETRDWLEREVL